MATRRTGSRPSMEQSSELNSVDVQISNPAKALYPSTAAFKKEPTNLEREVNG